MLKWLRKKGHRADYGLDLGSGCSRLCTNQEVQSTASCVLWDLTSNAGREWGDRAQSLCGRHPGHWNLVRPVRHGLLADCEAAEYLLKGLLGKARRPHLVVAAPAAATSLDLQILEELLRDCGAASVCLVPASACAALAAEETLDTPGLAILQLGQDLMQASLYRRSSVVMHVQIPLGARELRRQLREYLLRRHWLEVGEHQLEGLLPQLQVGGPGLSQEERWLELRGKDLASGLPRTLMVAGWELDRWLEPFLQPLLEMLTTLLEETAPDLLQPILERGFLLSGGLSQLTGLGNFLSQRLSMPVQPIDQPERAVARGLVRLIQNPQSLDLGSLG